VSVINIHTIDHVVLRTDKLSAMLDFYQHILGCKSERCEESIGLYQLRAGDALIDIVPVNSPLGKEGGPPPGEQGHNMDHVCLQLSPFNGPEILQFLDAQGVSRSDIERRYGAKGFGPSIYIYDPEGNRVELKGPPE
jgi:glyoxylase I family protein